MPTMNPRFSKSSQRSRSAPLRVNDVQVLSKSDTQFTLGCEEYRVFKKNGFAHHGMEGLKIIPREDRWAERNSDEPVESDEEAQSMRTVSRLSSQETLAPRESQSRRESQTDSLKDIPIEAEIEKGIQNSEPPANLGRARPEVFKTTWKEVIFVICILSSLSMAVSYHSQNFRLRQET